MELGSSPRHRTVLCFWLVALLLPLAVVRVCYIYLYPLEASVEASQEYASTVQTDPSDQVSNAADLPKQPVVLDNFQDGSKGSWAEAEVKEKGECHSSQDLGQGDWVFDSTGPSYTRDTCAFLSPDKDCLGNGKQFTDYLHWRWQPAKCELPSFDAAAFLRMMEGKVLAFVGDSIARNQGESLHCLLAQVDKDSYFIRHSETWKTVWVRFPSANFTLVVMWAPYLVEFSMQPDNKPIQVHLDVLQESWTSVLPQFDVAVFSTGQWYIKYGVYYLRGRVFRAHTPEGRLPSTEIHDIYRTALKAVFSAIPAVPGYKGLSLWRTWAVEHFEGGTWDTGGSCPSRVPYKSSSSGFQDSYQRQFLDIQLQEFSNAGLDHSAVWGLLNVTFMSWLRPDGHVGPRLPSTKVNENAGRVQHDCLHWCLPGPIDSWNSWLALELHHHFGAV